MKVKQKEEKTRSIILEKAREVFLEQGYHKASMRTIAKAAGISTWPIYTHYKNKAEVFVAVCCEGYDILLERFAPVIPKNKPALEKLLDMLYAYKEFYFEDQQYFRIMQLSTNPLAGIDIPQELRDKIFEKELQTRKIMIDIIEEGIKKKEIKNADPKALLLYLCSISEGIFQINDTGMLDQTGINIDKLIENIFELVCNGLVIK